MKLTDLRPCDSCGGPVGTLFHVVRHSVAVVNVSAVNEFFGMHQFFGGKASNALVENFAPQSHDAVTVAMDSKEFKELMVEHFVCNNCFMQPLDMAMLVERRNEARKKNADHSG